MKLLHSLLVLACLAGCSGSPTSPSETSPLFPELTRASYGVFVGVGPVIEARLAEEAAQQLWHIYPAPRHLLNFQQRVAETDGFARPLLEALQRNGYFVRQSHDPVVAPQCSQKPAQHKKKGDGAQYEVVPVCYLIDEVSGLLRLTLYTAGDTWSRLFVEEQGRLVPSGAWTQKKAP